MSDYCFRICIKPVNGRWFHLPWWDSYEKVRSWALACSGEVRLEAAPKERIHHANGKERLGCLRSVDYKAEPVFIPERYYRQTEAA